VLPPTIIARRLAYRVAYLGLGLWWFVRRPRTHGVKMIVRRGDEALFVRHTYGDREAWEFPGGGIHRAESPVQAATREVREEVGLTITDWTALGVVESKDFANAELHGFLAEYDGQPVQLDLGELAESCWAPIAAPPQPLGKHARAFLALPALADGASTHR
jgi:8-oxo-dGTP pyrophosphatase MutT (NUDIX family)